MNASLRSSRRSRAHFRARGDLRRKLALGASRPVKSGQGGSGLSGPGGSRRDNLAAGLVTRLPLRPRGRRLLVDAVRAVESCLVLPQIRTLLVPLTEVKRKLGDARTWRDFGRGGKPSPIPSRVRVLLDQTGQADPPEKRRSRERKTPSRQPQKPGMANEGASRAVLNIIKQDADLSTRWSQVLGPDEVERRRNTTEYVIPLVPPPPPPPPPPPQPIKTIGSLPLRGLSAYSANELKTFDTGPHPDWPACHIGLLCIQNRYHGMQGLRPSTQTRASPQWDARVRSGDWPTRKPP